MGRRKKTRLMPFAQDRRRMGDRRRFTEPWMRFLSMPIDVFFRRTFEEAIDMLCT